MKATPQKAPLYENIPSSEQSSIRAFVFENKEFDGHWHYHPEAELTFILRSSGLRYVGNHVSNFTPGDLVLLAPNTPHCWKNTHPLTSPAKAIVIQWKPDTLHAIPEFTPFHQLIKKAGAGLWFHAIHPPQMEQLLLKLLCANPINKYMHFIKLLSLLTESKHTTLASASFSSSDPASSESRLNTVIDFVKEKYTGKIKLLEVAQKVHMTEQSFSRFFSKTMQKPFFNYLNEFRINMACTLLVDTDRQVAEIGFSCGYESLPFFYKQFKKIKGISPLQYRRQHISRHMQS